MKENDKNQWAMIDSIRSSTNRILGGVSVACILLLINMILELFKK